MSRGDEASKVEIVFEGIKFDSYNDVVLHIAKIQGRLNKNLNYQRLNVGDNSKWQNKQRDYSTFSDSPGRTAVHFKKLENNLISYLQKADVVVGCVAWLTSERILRVLAQKAAVSIIVQKEDFLRPDSKEVEKKDLRRLYQQLPSLYRASKAISEAAVLETNTMDSEAVPIEGIRCVGFSRKSAGVQPTMHNKFVVFCRRIFTSYSDQHGTIEPYGVWTGSFNFTYNASKSFENALYVEDFQIANAYFSEWGQIASLSEALNWTEDHLHPEYLIGTGT